MLLGLVFLGRMPFVLLNQMYMCVSACVLHIIDVLLLGCITLLNCISCHWWCSWIAVAGSISLSWRQVLKHAWAKGCSGLLGVSGELPFHNSRSCSWYCYKPTCISVTTNSWSTIRGCFRKGNCLWWLKEICYPFLHSLGWWHHRPASQVTLHSQTPLFAL